MKEKDRLMPTSLLIAIVIVASDFLGVIGALTLRRKNSGGSVVIVTSKGVLYYGRSPLEEP